MGIVFNAPFGHFTEQQTSIMIGDIGHGSKPL